MQRFAEARAALADTKTSRDARSVGWRQSHLARIIHAGPTSSGIFQPWNISGTICRQTSANSVRQVAANDISRQI